MMNNVCSNSDYILINRNDRDRITTSSTSSYNSSLHSMRGSVHQPI